MPVKVYKLDASPPARAVMMACEVFNVKAELADVDLLGKEHLKPEYLKKNPLHTVPVLEDGDFIIHDSHAILQYLAEAYGKDDSWYPKDVKKRAMVNQKLFFDTAILFPRLRNITYSALVEGERKVPQKKFDDIKEAYGFLEEFLSRSKYLAGDHATIADIAAFSTVSSMHLLTPLDSKAYPKSVAWVKVLEQQPYATKWNEPGLKIFEEFIKKSIDF